MTTEQGSFEIKIEKFKKVASQMIGAKKVMVEGVKERVRERRRRWEFKYSYIYWLVWAVGCGLGIDWSWKGYWGILRGGFLGGYVGTKEWEEEGHFHLP